MKSEQVHPKHRGWRRRGSAPTLVLLACLTGGCEWFQTPPAEPLASPYAQRQVWAIAPLRNESGSQHASGLAVADHLQRQLENASRIDVLPVNRAIEAMTALDVPQVATEAQALRLLAKLGVDALLVGTITAYDPYDPPKLGLALELYVRPGGPAAPDLDVRRLTSAATDGSARPVGRPRQPVTVVSAVLDGGDPHLRPLLERYASQRGAVPDPDAWRRYRMSMDLFTEFAGYVMSRRLLDAERQRLGPAAVTQPAGP